MFGSPEHKASGEIVADAWDYSGRPAVRSRTGGWTCAAMILGTNINGESIFTIEVVELNERLTTLGIAVNLVTYLTKTMHLGNAAAANTVTNFMGTSFMLCLLGGFVGDTFLGRYLTIAIFTAVQASGVTILAISTAVEGMRPAPCTADGVCEKATGAQLGMLYLALYTTALGTGGLKSSVSGFGSDQFDEANKEEKVQMQKFFDWFFFFISFGSLLAVTVLVYIQDHIGRPWGYGICAASIALGLMVFLAGTRQYRFKQLVGSPLTQIATVVVAAWRKRGRDLPSDPTLLYIGAAEEEKGTPEKNGRQRLQHTDQLRFLDRAAIPDVPAAGRQPSALPSKWRLSPLTDVEEVKIVVRMLPIWATTIMFWTVYAQMTTFSVAQATTMDRRIGSHFQIPPASLTVFFVASILATVPVYDRLIVPLARRLTAHPNGLSPLQRMAVGLLLSILAMVAAALSETKRLRAAHRGAVPVSVFWLVPQFFLVGAGQAFTYIGQLDFFLRECPKGMKTMSTGLFLSTLSMGFFVSSALVAVVHKVTGTGGHGAWLANSLNQGKLNNFYWLLAVLSGVNLAAYLLAAKGYIYKEQRYSVEDEGVTGVELAEEACYQA
ncbi:hypothetical protein ZIOFF_016518 [Zingiber officinale]|uniref:Nitrate transporter 1.1 n=1 Tax=Zingiber officinale TaxID=94328 RepID=A0A8J5LHB0_ZINOF|nr:hypothetical protein ZIOFF_016518 [Zingiber officinale]